MGVEGLPRDVLDVVCNGHLARQDLASLRLTSSTLRTHVDSTLQQLYPICDLSGLRLVPSTFRVLACVDLSGIDFRLLSAAQLLASSGGLTRHLAITLAQLPCLTELVISEAFAREMGRKCWAAAVCNSIFKDIGGDSQQRLKQQQLQQQQQQAQQQVQQQVQQQAQQQVQQLQLPAPVLVLAAEAEEGLEAPAAPVPVPVPAPAPLLLLLPAPEEVHVGAAGVSVVDAGEVDAAEVDAGPQGEQEGDGCAGAAAVLLHLADFVQPTSEPLSAATLLLPVAAQEPLPEVLEQDSQVQVQDRCQAAVSGRAEVPCASTAGESGASHSGHLPVLEIELEVEEHALVDEGDETDEELCGEGVDHSELLCQALLNPGPNCLMDCPRELMWSSGFRACNAAMQFSISPVSPRTSSVQALSHAGSPTSAAAAAAAATRDDASRDHQLDQQCDRGTAPLTALPTKRASRAALLEATPSCPQQQLHLRWGGDVPSSPEGPAPGAAAGQAAGAGAGAVCSASTGSNACFSKPGFESEHGQVEEDVGEEEALRACACPGSAAELRMPSASAASTAGGLGAAGLGAAGLGAALGTAGLGTALAQPCVPPRPKSDGSASCGLLTAQGSLDGPLFDETEDQAEEEEGEEEGEVCTALQAGVLALSDTLGTGPEAGVGASSACGEDAGAAGEGGGCERMVDSMALPATQTPGPCHASSSSATGMADDDAAASALETSCPSPAGPRASRAAREAAREAADAARRAAEAAVAAAEQAADPQELAYFFSAAEDPHANMSAVVWLPDWPATLPRLHTLRIASGARPGAGAGAGAGGAGGRAGGFAAMGRGVGGGTSTAAEGGAAAAPGAAHVPSSSGGAVAAAAGAGSGAGTAAACPSMTTLLWARRSALGGIRTLDLSGTRLGSLPADLLALCLPSSLRRLRLSGCGLSTLPTSLLALSGLQELDISANVLRQLPDQISTLVALTRLEAAENPLGTLPSFLGACTALERLGLSGTQLRNPGALPLRELSALPALASLSLAHNWLAMPDAPVPSAAAAAAAAATAALLAGADAPEAGAAAGAAASTARAPFGTHRGTRRPLRAPAHILAGFGLFNPAPPAPAEPYSDGPGAAGGFCPLTPWLGQLLRGKTAGALVHLDLSDAVPWDQQLVLPWSACVALTRLQTLTLAGNCGGLLLGPVPPAYQHHAQPATAAANGGSGSCSVSRSGRVDGGAAEAWSGVERREVPLPVLQGLDISQCGLEELPALLLLLPHLRWLDARGNCLAALPSWARHMVDLQHLHISGNSALVEALSMGAAAGSCATTAAWLRGVAVHALD